MKPFGCKYKTRNHSVAFFLKKNSKFKSEKPGKAIFSQVFAIGFHFSIFHFHFSFPSLFSIDEKSLGMKSFTTALFVLIYSCASAQVSPPGLGKANNAFWSAIALRQDLDSAETWQSVTYIGHGRKSNPSDRNLFSKNAIWVFNQEVYRAFGKNWRISFALSYRHESQFDESDGQFLISGQPYEHELRYYSRISKTWHFGRFKFVPTLRQEIRRFYEPGFKAADEQMQFRTRFRLQLTTDLTSDKVHRIVLGAESLFSGSIYKNHQQHGFGYREARFTLYYSLDPPNFPVAVNVGYMNDLIGAAQVTDVHYFCVDLIYDDLFPLKRKTKRPVIDNLE